MARSFTDNQNRQWPVEVNVTAVKRLRDRLGVDLLDLGGDGDAPEHRLLIRLIADPVLLVDVLFVVCEDAAIERGVGDEDFGRAMAGDAIDAATRALLEEIADFTPSPRERARATKVIQTTWRAIEVADDVLDAKVDSAIEAGLQKVRAACGEPSGSSPAPSGSTRAP